MPPPATLLEPAEWEFARAFGRLRSRIVASALKKLKHSAAYTCDMREKPYRVLFLCTENSARSIMAESLLNRLGRGRFTAYSAGSFPKGEVHAYALELLRRHNLPTDGLRSKSWTEFARPDSPKLDFVFTVCDDAAGEVCPVWPTQPITAHWGVADPAAVDGSEAERRLAFAQTLRMLRNRIAAFVSLPISSLDKMSLRLRLEKIGSRGRV